MFFRSVLVSVLALSLFFLAAWYSGSRDPVNEVMAAEERTGRVLQSQAVPIGGGVTLHVVSAGPRDGPPVLLLHGFPGFWFSWYKQIDALADAGYYVIIPDLPGFNRSTAPTSAESYTLQTCAEDIVALMDKMSVQSAFVAGHDMGGGVALALARDHPDRVRKIILYNGVAPLAPLGAKPDWLGRWVAPLLSRPVATELVSRTGDWWLLARALTDNASPATFSKQDMEIYKSAWAQSDGITAALSMARPATSDGKANVIADRLTVPVLAYIGGADSRITAKEVEQAVPFLDAETLIVVPGAGHWLPLEDPKTTNFSLLSFFQ